MKPVKNCGACKIAAFRPKNPDFGDYRYFFRFGKICCARNRELMQAGAESNVAGVTIVDLRRERDTNGKLTFQLITDVAT